VGERGARLSGGERQRISLARAFLKDAPILLLDEPTSSVDMKTEAAILKATERLMRGRTTFMIAHRLSTLETCDVMLELEHGRLVRRACSSDAASHRCSGNIGCEPYPGIAWQAMQYAVGFQRLGHDAYYFETSSSWPYDPIRKTRVNTSVYAVPYLAEVAEMFGFSDRWAYRRSYGDKSCLAWTERQRKICWRTLTLF